MGWLARKINQLSKRGAKETRALEEEKYQHHAHDEHIMFDENDPLVSMDVIEANGGYIVRIYHTMKAGKYDEAEVKESFHLVHDKEELSSDVGKLLTFEILRQNKK